MVSLFSVDHLVDFPSIDSKKLSYELVSDTDMLELAKSKTFALSCAVSTNGELVALYARDRKIRVFEVRSGKLVRTIDDNAQIYVDYQLTKGTEGAAVVKSDMLYLEKLDFERRMAVEKDIERQWDLSKANLKQKKDSLLLSQHPEA